jgi:NADH-quinone oxidoreductase subunit K
MFEITLAHYLFLSASIFTLGVFGIFVNRKNVIVILMSIELILLSVNINMVAFSVYLQNITGQIFTLFILTVAAAEVTAVTVMYLTVSDPLSAPV